MAPVILLTRPDPDAAGFATQLRDRLGPDVAIVQSPLLGITPLAPLPDLRDAAGVIFTSRNGVRSYLAMGGPALACYCVGDATADAARGAGMSAISAQGDVAGLIERIAADGPDGIWYHLHGAHVRGALVERLAARGVNVRQHVIYRQDEIALTAQANAVLTGRQPVLLPLFSPRTAALFAAAPRIVAPLYVAAISAATRDGLRGVRWTRCAVADRPDAVAMLDACVSLWHDLRRVEGEGDAQ